MKENISNEKQNEQSCKTDVMQSVIKGQHLRIGNLLYFNGNHNEIGVVSEIMKNDLNKVAPYKIGINHRIDIYYEIDKLKPIPITEESLLKFGFKDQKRNLEKNYFRTVLFQWLIIEYTLDGYVLVINGLQLKKIKYVHQLQNLYLALTGIELTVA